MKTQTHTPGPWNVGFRDLGGESICCKVYGNDNQEVATVGRWNSVGDEANARLIAAAPDMLSLLKRTAVRLESGTTAEIKFNHSLSNAIREVIAKAEGRI